MTHQVIIGGQLYDCVITADPITGLPIAPSGSVPATPRFLGTLANGTPVVQALAGASLPATLTLDSTAVGRLIELSTDGGVNYFTPTYDATTTPMINVSLLSKATHARFTGQASDNWSIL